MTDMIFGKSSCFLVVVCSLIAGGVSAQDTVISIDDCIRLARENYPLIRKHDLIEKSAAYSLANASKVFLPQFSLNGQATYQSETIRFPKALNNIPGASFPVISKDQFRVMAEATQLIYDAGNSRNQKALIHANEQVAQQSVEVSLNALKERVIQVYFAVLLIDEQLKQNDTRIATLNSALQKAEAALREGTAFRSQVDELKAAVLTAQMTATEFRASRQAYLEMLSLLTALPSASLARLQMPGMVHAPAEINRPELKLIDLQKKMFDVRENQLSAAYKPVVSAFIQGAYGRPTLNIIENKTGPWWMGGLRLNWSLGALYTQKNNRNILNTDRASADLDRETFLFNTRLQLKQQEGDIGKYAQLVSQDDELIALRASVVKSAQAQLDNGVITVNEYISKVNEENLARQTRVLHAIQLLQARYIYRNTSGN